MKTFVVELSRSSHPDYQYFASTRVMGRQLASRFTTRAAADQWVSRALAAGQKHGWTGTVNNQIGGS